jgi:hypothetical protein
MMFIIGFESVKRLAEVPPGSHTFISKRVSKD